MLFDGTYERLYDMLLNKNSGNVASTNEDFTTLAKTIGVAPDRFVNEMMSFIARRKKHDN